MLLSTLSAYLLLGPRVLYAMAQAGQFPAIAARLRPRVGTPAVATLFQVVMTLILLWTGSFESIVLYASVGLSIFSMLAMSSIFVLRRKRPDLPRPFRTPGYPVTPAVYLILTVDADHRGLLAAAGGLGGRPGQHPPGNPFLLLLETGRSVTRRRGHRHRCWPGLVTRPRPQLEISP